MDLTKFGFSVNKSSQKKEESDDKKEKKKEYEKKRKRKFQETWIVEYPGLAYEKFESSEDEREAKMFFTVFAVIIKSRLISHVQCLWVQMRSEKTRWLLTGKARHT